MVGYPRVLAQRVRSLDSLPERIIPSRPYGGSETGQPIDLLDLYRQFTYVVWVGRVANRRRHFARTARARLLAAAVFLAEPGGAGDLLLRWYIVGGFGFFGVMLALAALFSG